MECCFYIVDRIFLYLWGKQKDEELLNIGRRGRRHYDAQKKKGWKGEKGYGRRKTVVGEGETEIGKR